MNKLIPLLPFAFIPLLASGQDPKPVPVVESCICKLVCPSHKVQSSERRKDKAPAPVAKSLASAIRQCADRPDLRLGDITTSERRRKVDGGVEVRARVKLTDQKPGVSWRSATGFPRALEESYPSIVVSDVHLERVDVALKTWTVQFDVTVLVPDAK